jgi:hypothetical protein
MIDHNEETGIVELSVKGEGYAQQLAISIMEETNILRDNELLGESLGKEEMVEH